MHVGAHVDDALDRVRLVALYDGGMRREHDFTFDSINGLFKSHLFFFHFFAQQFKAGKKGVPFIEVVHIYGDAQFAQGAYTTDAQHNFLGDAFFAKPAVQLSGYPSVVVARDVCVQQVQGGIAKGFQLPDLTFYLQATDFHGDTYAGVFHKIVIVIVVGIVRFTHRVDPLIGIALFPFDAEAYDGIIVVFGAFHVIASQDAQATRVSFEGLV